MLFTPFVDNVDIDLDDVVTSDDSDDDDDDDDDNEEEEEEETVSRMNTQKTRFLVSCFFRCMFISYFYIYFSTFTVYGWFFQSFMFSSSFSCSGDYKLVSFYLYPPPLVYPSLFLSLSSSSSSS